MKCVATCPNSALTAVAEQRSITEVLDEVKRDFLFYLNSHGGLTISGGEPLYHPNFTLELLQHSKQIGIPTALETAGHGATKTLMEISRHTDLLLYDIKHMDPQIHMKHTGVSNELILKNLKLLANTESEKIIVRVPIIPNFNYSKESIRKIARYVSSLGIYRMDLLPYHRFAEAKYKMLDKPYLLKGKPDLTKEEIAPLEEAAQSYGLSTNIGGGRPTDTILTQRKRP